MRAMKRISTILLAAMLALTASAQVNVWRNGYLSQFEKPNVDSITFSKADPYKEYASQPYHTLSNLYWYNYNIEPSEMNIQIAYYMQKQLYIGLEELGYTRHNDFGYAAVCMLTESRGQDFVCLNIGYNWFSAWGNVDKWSDSILTASTAGIDNYLIWNTCYAPICASNYIIAVHPNDLYEVAQAKALRAFNYMQLAQLYQVAYSESSLDLRCVPLVLDTIPVYLVRDQPCATVAEVYNQIKADLDDACRDLQGFQRTDKSAINQAVAFGLRARLNLWMHNYADAAADADRALQFSGATPLTIEQASVPGFASADADNVIWANIITEEDDIVLTNIINWVSHMSSFYEEGYTSVAATRWIASALYDEIPATDVRKGWWLDENLQSPLLDAEGYNAMKNYIIEQETPYLNVKFGTGDGSISGSGAAAGDWIIMRAEEMILIKAEGLARAGQDGAGVLTEFVQQFRDPSYNIAIHSLSIEDEIWWQRRVELWGEGFAYGDILRLGKGVTRTNSSNWPVEWKEDVPAGDERLSLVLPAKFADNEVLAVWQKGDTSLYMTDYRSRQYVDSISFGEAKERDAMMLNSLFHNGKYVVSPVTSRIKAEKWAVMGDTLTFDFSRNHNLQNAATIPLIVEADSVFANIGLPTEVSFEAGESTSPLTTLVIQNIPVGTYRFTITIPDEYFRPDVNERYQSISYEITVYDQDEWESYEIQQGIVYDGLVNAFYGTGQPGWYVSYQRRDNEDGSFDIHIINPYTQLPQYRDGNYDDPIADVYGLYDGFPYNYPEDVDGTREYNWDIHVSADGYVTFDDFDMGMAWSYGEFTASHYNPDISGLWNLEEKKIIFPAGSSACFMADYNGRLTSEDIIIYLDVELWKENRPWTGYTEKQGIAFDGLVNAFYDTGQPGWYVTYQQRYNEDGSFDIHIINPYTQLPKYKDGNYDDPIADEYGLYGGFPFNYPEDVDYSQEYNWDLHVAADGSVTFNEFEMGMTWSYGAFAAKQLNSGTWDAEKQCITFPAGSIACAMADYNSGAFYPGSRDAVIYLDVEQWRDEWQKEHPVINVAEKAEDYAGYFTMTGQSQFTGESENMNVEIKYVDGQLTLEGITYASPIAIEFDDLTKTISIAPQQLDTLYGTYDIVLYTTTAAGVSVTEPIVLALTSDGIIQQEYSSPADGYLLRSEVAGGWLLGHYNLIFTPNDTPASAPRRTPKVQTHSLEKGKVAFKPQKASQKLPAKTNNKFMQNEL